MPRNHIHEIVNRAKQLTDSVIVAYSCGKDSSALLQICVQNFKHVSAFFMYTTPGLSFHEKQIAFVKRRYGIDVLRVPHWSLARMLKTGSFRMPNTTNAALPLLKQKDVEDYVRRKLGIEWIAWGMKKFESLERTGLISSVNGIDEKRKRMYPIGDWSNGYVFRYLQRNKLPLPPEYAFGQRSFSGNAMDGGALLMLRDYFPDDYAKVLERFPDADAEVFRYERFGDATTRPKEDRKKARK
jgi:phosphoadenosine phosphosulfate reductase